MSTPHAPTRRPARRGRAVAVVLTAAALLVACAGAPAEDPTSSATPTSPATKAATELPEETEAPAEPVDPVEPVAPEAAPAEPPAAEVAPAVIGEGIAPATVTIPRIELTEDLVDLGLQDDGTMETPEDWDRAGWFTGGGRPGGRGPTVIAGHVDSRTGPAVFFRLTELEVGDAVQVTDVDGVVHDYEVYQVEDVPKDDYPTARVFGAIPIDELRLITCTGEFDTDTQRHDDNRVVYARAVGA
ncbi:class F sortase [Serinibacter arcticus]|uniref:Class F sortase n=1 Tax=Serinibacter arcticus TaxID=1655435 RepID=A0A2U1ZXG6_9MICO|nr:class F sortase [Serinibacter arcticus]PWD51661.1 class F sortase [Serinibacter arcticus]